jgi:putative transcriptional regulator
VIQPRFLSGQLLLAMPGIGDERFERAVIAMCVHDDNGALGIMANRRHERLSVRALMEQLDIDPGRTPREAMVLEGGPVEPGRGFVLHTPDYSGDGTIHVGNVWGLTASLGVLTDIAEGRGPAKWFLALGYAGWGEGQLESEMTRHGWASVEAGEARSLLYDAPLDSRWGRAFAMLGVDVGRLAGAAGHA